MMYFYLEFDSIDKHEKFCKQFSFETKRGFDSPTNNNPTLHLPHEVSVKWNRNRNCNFDSKTLCQ